uniref:Uncharacterized protein n=1 Tax=Amphimedon queenslandica TaxID=400682 RepID=A0A1X7UXT7_AMPQE
MSDLKVIGSPKEMRDGLTLLEPPDTKLEIEEKEALLKKLKEDIEKEINLQSDLQHELCRVNKSLCVMDEQISDSTREAYKCEKAIETNITRIQSMQLEIKQKKQYNESQTKQRLFYSERMRAHKRKVLEFVNKLAVTQELMEARTTWEEAKDKFGDSKLIANDIDYVDQRLNEINHKITEKVDQKKQTEKGIQTMRNEAEVTKLLLLSLLIKSSLQTTMKPIASSINPPAPYDTDGPIFCGGPPCSKLYDYITNEGLAFNADRFYEWNRFSLKFFFHKISSNYFFNRIDIYYYSYPSSGYGLPRIKMYIRYPRPFHGVHLTFINNYKVSQSDNDTIMLSMIVLNAKPYSTTEGISMLELHSFVTSSDLAVKFSISEVKCFIDT